MSTTIPAAEIPALVGQEFEPSSWLEISQERVDRFADATNDHQFIHVDAEQAARTPFGGTIAHGYLTLSLLPYLTEQSAPLPEHLQMAINYGSDRVRYLQPVRVGQRIRARQKVLDATEKNPGQWLLRTRVTVDIEGEERPALIADVLSLYIVAPPRG